MHMSSAAVAAQSAPDGRLTSIASGMDICNYYCHIREDNLVTYTAHCMYPSFNSSQGCFAFRACWQISLSESVAPAKVATMSKCAGVDKLLWSDRVHALAVYAAQNGFIHSTSGENLQQPPFMMCYLEKAYNV